MVAAEQVLLDPWSLVESVPDTLAASQMLLHATKRYKTPLTYKGIDFGGE